MKKIFAVALLSTFVAAPALAEGSNAYLFGELGTTTYQNVSPFPNPGNVGLGIGYQFDKNLGAELGYTIFGDSTVTGTGGSATLKASSFHPALVASLPFNEQLSAFGKIGLAMNHAEASNTLGYSASSSQSSLYLGLGLQFNINKQFSIRGQYESFGNFDNYSNPMSASALSAAAVFNF